MKVDLKGSVFVITGKLTKMNRRDSEAAIRKVGGSTAKSVTTNTSYVIVGDRPSSKYTKAKNMGIPCLTEDDFQALISGESVEVEEVGAAGDRSVDELLGEVRSVMQGTPSVEMWSALVKLLDACRAEDVHVLTEYIDGYITRWTTESMKGLSGSSLALADDKKDPRMRWYYYYYQRGVEGELRVAPEHWVGEMQQGVESPKFKVVRALELTSTKITSTAVAKIIAHPSLTHLETLELPESLAPSKGLVKALCEHETLEHLKLGKIDEKTGPSFVALGTEPRQLTRLDLSAVDTVYKLRTRQKICQLINAPFFSTVKTLHLSGGRQYDTMFFEQMAKHNALPQVDHLHFDRSYHVAPLIAEILNSPWAASSFKRLTARELYFHPDSEKDWRKVFATDFSGHLDLLDLSGFVAGWQVENPEEEIARMLGDELPTSRLLDHVGTLVLGKWKTKALAEKLAQTFPELTVQ